MPRLAQFPVLGHLVILQQLYDEVIIPTAVDQELLNFMLILFLFATMIGLRQEEEEQTQPYAECHFERVDRPTVAGGDGGHYCHDFGQL
jgi:hypothetical protein